MNPHYHPYNRQKAANIYIVANVEVNHGFCAPAWKIADTPGILSIPTACDRSRPYLEANWLVSTYEIRKLACLVLDFQVHQRTGFQRQAEQNILT
jgi:hypothetical protein